MDFSVATPIKYRRMIRFDDDGIHQKLRISLSTAVTLKTLYETLPLRWETAISLTLCDSKGKALFQVEATPDPKKFRGPNPRSNLSPQFPADGPDAKRFANVASVKIKRGTGGMRIDFDKPISIDWVSRPTISKQNNSLVIGRALQIVLPTKLAARKELSVVGYRITPVTQENK